MQLPDVLEITQADIDFACQFATDAPLHNCAVGTALRRVTGLDVTVGVTTAKFPDGSFVMLSPELADYIMAFSLCRKVTPRKFHAWHSNVTSPVFA